MRDIYVVDLRNITDVVFNPTGSSLALMRGKNPVSIYSFRERNKRLFELKDKRKGLKKRQNLPVVDGAGIDAKTARVIAKGDIVPVAMCYAPDARHFVLSNSLGEIVIYDTREYQPQAYIQGKAIATSLVMSSNNYFVAAGTGKNVDIWNFQARELRTSVPMSGNVTGMDFRMMLQCWL